MIKTMVYIKLILLILILFVLSCTNNKEKAKVPINQANVKNNETMLKYSNNANIDSSMETVDFDYEISALSYGQYMSYLSDQSEFSLFMLFIRKKTNDRLYDCEYQCGNLMADRYYSHEEYIDCDMTIDYYPGGNPYYYCQYTVDFTPSQMNELLNYINTHNDYFFNGDEFTGYVLPFVNEAMSFDYKNYSFGIIFFPTIPNSYIIPIKIINKNIDELEPNSPLAGLFQKWEDEHFPLIISSNEYCW